jgi:predicted nucleotidyltransferase
MYIHVPFVVKVVKYIHNGILFTHPYWFSLKQQDECSNLCRFHSVANCSIVRKQTTSHSISIELKVEYTFCNIHFLMTIIMLLACSRIRAYISGYFRPISILEISTRGHEYEKGYRIKNVVTFLRRQFPGKQQCWCQIWPRKSGIHVHTTYVWKVWCKSGPF